MRWPVKGDLCGEIQSHKRQTGLTLLAQEEGRFQKGRQSVLLLRERETRRARRQIHH